jgi:hypothetical protein
LSKAEEIRESKTASRMGKTEKGGQEAGTSDEADGQMGMGRKDWVGSMELRARQWCLFFPYFH